MSMQDIKNALIKKLSLILPELPVYDEAVEQGMQQPCFFVLLMEGNQARGINRRRQRFNSFDVHYFPDRDAAPREACELMAERLYAEIEYLTGSEGDTAAPACGMKSWMGFCISSSSTITICSGSGIRK